MAHLALALVVDAAAAELAPGPACDTGVHWVQMPHLHVGHPHVHGVLETPMEAHPYQTHGLVQACSDQRPC